MNNFGNRKTIRLQKYDYSDNGYYFVTICTQNRKNMFGNIIDGKMVLNNIGNMIERIWNQIPIRFNCIELEQFQIMPNHIHGIIVIVGAGLVPALNQKMSTNDKRATTRVAPTIGNIIGAFKSETTDKYIINVKNNNWPPFNKRLFQRNYYEHIIRSEYELNKIRQYIRDNPKNWEDDINNLKSKGGEATWIPNNNQYNQNLS